MSQKDKILKRAQKYVKKGAFEKAVADYRSLIDMDSADVSLRLRLGDLFVKTGQLEDAVREYTSAAKYNARRGFYLKAIAVYKRALTIESGSSTDTHYKLAELYTKQRLIADAMSQYTIILNTFEQKGMDNEELDILKKMVELDPSNMSIKLKLADMFRKLDFIDDALEVYRLVCGKLFESGNLKKAEEIFLELYGHYPDEPRVLTGLMDIYREKSEDEEFVKYASKLLNIHVQSGELEEALGVSKAILFVRADHGESLSFIESYGGDELPDDLADEGLDAIEEIPVSNESAEFVDESAAGESPEQTSLEDEVNGEECEELEIEEAEEDGVDDEDIEIALEGFDDEGGGESEPLEESQQGPVEKAGHEDGDEYINLDIPGLETGEDALLERENTVEDKAGLNEESLKGHFDEGLESSEMAEQGEGESAPASISDEENAVAESPGPADEPVLDEEELSGASASSLEDAEDDAVIDFIEEGFDAESGLPDESGVEEERAAGGAREQVSAPDAEPIVAEGEKLVEEDLSVDEGIEIDFEGFTETGSSGEDEPSVEEGPGDDVESAAESDTSSGFDEEDELPVIEESGDEITASEELEISGLDDNEFPTEAEAAGEIEFVEELEAPEPSVEDEPLVTEESGEEELSVEEGPVEDLEPSTGLETSLEESADNAEAEDELEIDEELETGEEESGTEELAVERAPVQSSEGEELLDEAEPHDGELSEEYEAAIVLEPSIEELSGEEESLPEVTESSEDIKEEEGPADEPHTSSGFDEEDELPVIEESGDEITASEELEISGLDDNEFPTEAEAAGEIEFVEELEAPEPSVEDEPLVTEESGEEELSVEEGPVEDLEPSTGLETSLEESADNAEAEDELAVEDHVDTEGEEPSAEAPADELEASWAFGSYEVPEVKGDGDETASPILSEEVEASEDENAAPVEYVTEEPGAEGSVDDEAAREEFRASESNEGEEQELVEELSEGEEFSEETESSQSFIVDAETSHEAAALDELEAIDEPEEIESSGEEDAAAEEKISDEDDTSFESETQGVMGDDEPLIEGDVPENEDLSYEPELPEVSEGEDEFEDRELLDDTVAEAEPHDGEISLDEPAVAADVFTDESLGVESAPEDLGDDEDVIEEDELTKPLIEEEASLDGEAPEESGEVDSSLETHGGDETEAEAEGFESPVSFAEDEVSGEEKSGSDDDLEPVEESETSLGAGELEAKGPGELEAAQDEENTLESILEAEPLEVETDEDLESADVLEVLQGETEGEELSDHGELETSDELREEEPIAEAEPHDGEALIEETAGAETAPEDLGEDESIIEDEEVPQSLIEEERPIEDEVSDDFDISPAEDAPDEDHISHELEPSGASVDYDISPAEGFSQEEETPSELEGGDEFEASEKSFEAAEQVEIYTEPELEEAIQNLARSSAAGDVFETYEEFKTGFEKQLSTEDAGTHFNLGKEYLEMELFKEAAREFKIALKDKSLGLDCYINLAACAMSEANFEEAIIYYLKVLKAFNGSDEQRQGFLYDLASSYSASGQEREAEGIFISIYETDPKFRDVAKKIKKFVSHKNTIPQRDSILEVELL
ncbi:MAG: tetratricopeptide repeat protein [Thermodesulfobacteriota bacterium]